MKYISINQAAKGWSISSRRIQVLCSQERIEEACRMENIWGDPRNAQKPADARIKSGKYIKTKGTERCGEK